MVVKRYYANPTKIPALYQDEQAWNAYQLAKERQIANSCSQTRNKGTLECTKDKESLSVPSSGIENLDFDWNAKEPKAPILMAAERANLTPQQFGAKYWGRVGGEILDQIDYYVKQGRPVALVGPSGSGKTEMLTQYCERYLPPTSDGAKNYQMTSATTCPKFFGSVNPLASKIRVAVPICKLKKVTVLPDFSSFLTQKRDVEDFCGRLSMLIDGHYEYPLVKMSGNETDESIGIRKRYNINLDVAAGVMNYDYDGELILCMIPEHLDKIPTALKNRFAMLHYEQAELAEIFDHILTTGFLTEKNLPCLFSHRDFIMSIFPDDLKHLRGLRDLALDLKAAMLKRHVPDTQITTEPITDFDLLTALKYFRLRLNNQRGGLQKELTKRVVQYFLPIYDLMAISEILGVQPKTLQNLLSEGKELFQQIDADAADAAEAEEDADDPNYGLPPNTKEVRD